MRLCLYRGSSAGLGGGREKGRGTVGPFLLGCEVGQAVCCLKLQKTERKALAAGSCWKVTFPTGSEEQA